MNRHPSLTALEALVPSVSRRTFMCQCGGLLASAAVGGGFVPAVKSAPLSALTDQPASSPVEPEEVIYDADPGWAGAGG